MSFATSLALLVGLLVSAPLLAHLLRRGRTTEQEFPPAKLVPPLVVTSKQRKRLEDRLLLSLRALMVLALAVLGATPFVRCSHLSVDRQSGASVALALVIDDSQSMRARLDDGTPRFDAALSGARQLLRSAREGDALAVIAAGRPARLILNATTDLQAASEALEELRVTDRATALDDAVNLARASLKALPHVDKRIVLLSDLAAPALASEGEPPVWTPLEALSEPHANCGLVTAEHQGRNAVVTVGCNDVAAARDRRIELLLQDEPDGEPIASAPLSEVHGLQHRSIGLNTLGFELLARLSGSDSIPGDNRAPVSQASSDLSVGVYADSTRASVVTGGPTVLEQALGALDPELALKPLSSLPESVADLEAFAALYVDDPPGLSPEMRNALSDWVERGGVLIGFLGPSSVAAELAASIEPLARQGAQWESGVELRLAVDTLGWLGEQAASLADLGRGGRVRLDAVDLPGTEVVGRWQDGVPWLFRRDVGRGVVLTLGLPVSVEQSDFALRPGFLSLLNWGLELARQRTGPKRSVAGKPWLFPANAKLQVVGPTGPLESHQSASPHAVGALQQQVVPQWAGRYEIEIDGNAEQRLVSVDPDELITQPIGRDSTAAAVQAAKTNPVVDASPQWALLLLVLFAAELMFRVFGDAWGRRWSNWRTKSWRVRTR